MPNRILKDSVRTSRSLAQLTAEEFRHFTLLLAVADDFGRFDASPEVIKGFCYPRFSEEQIPLPSIEQWTNRLADSEIGILQLYEHEGCLFGYFQNWDKYQQRRAKFSKFPAPPDCTADDSDCTADAQHMIPAMDSIGDHLISNDHLVVVEKRESRSDIREARSESELRENAQEPTTATAGYTSQFLSGLINAYSEEIGPVTVAIEKDMIQFADMPPELGPEAVSEAAKSNVRKWSYVKAVLESWQKNGRSPPKSDKKARASPVNANYYPIPPDL